MVQIETSYANSSLENRVAAARQRGDGNAFNVLIAIIAGLALLMTVGIANIALTGQAEARVKTGDKGQLADTCRSYQDDYDRTMSELAQARANGNYQKAYELRNRLSLIHNLWDDECSGDFGSIAYLISTADAVDGSAAPQTGAVDAGSGQTKGKDGSNSLGRQTRTVAP
jgi:hypothetical protein